MEGPTEPESKQEAEKLVFFVGGCKQRAKRALMSMPIVLLFEADPLE